ncbi:MAG: magnesium protoporphyrin IX methyltransferase [Pseudomonadota bacterium]
MSSPTYEERRSQIENYFDRTAMDAWSRMTSDAPLSRVRETVRAGRERMRSELIALLPSDLTGRRILDAGCGTGQLAIELAARGAEVIAIDLSPNLVAIARQRTDASVLRGSVAYLSGDMLDPALGRFDHVVAMDSLIHYRAEDAVQVIASLAARTRDSMALTFVPSTPALTAMYYAGKVFPRADRAPAIEPIRESKLLRLSETSLALSNWQLRPATRVSNGFYISNALHVERTQASRMRKSDAALQSTESAADNDATASRERSA